MSTRIHHWPVAAVLALLAAGCGDRPTTLEEYRSTEVTLPNGKKILAETMRTEMDVMRGMMFRNSLAPDRGMLFIHRAPGEYAYWMYQVRIPLDIIWMNAQGDIVEIYPNAPPCPSKSAKECPTFGGHQKALYALELAGGMAEKYGLHVGSHLSF